MLTQLVLQLGSDTGNCPAPLQLSERSVDRIPQGQSPFALPYDPLWGSLRFPSDYAKILSLPRCLRPAFALDPRT
jgi:hypothetical protein